MEMTQAIDDIGSLPDRKVHDQEMKEIGKISHIYAIDGDGVPVWVGCGRPSACSRSRTSSSPLPG